MGFRVTKSELACNVLKTTRRSPSRAPTPIGWGPPVAALDPMWGAGVSNRLLGTSTLRDRRFLAEPGHRVARVGAAFHRALRSSHTRS